MSAGALADLDAACGSEPSDFCDLVFNLTDSDTTTKVIDWVATGPLKIVLILLGGILLRKLVHRSIDRFVDGQLASIEAEAKAEAETISQSTELDLLDAFEAKARERLSRVYERSSRAGQRLLTLKSVLLSITTFVVGTLTFLLILSEASIDLGPLIAGAGVAGIALGFGAQSLVRDFLAGIFIVVEDQYGVGDIVDLGEATGTVEQVSLRTTRLRDADGTVWYVPNGGVQRVANKSKLWARSVVDVTIAYGADITLATEVIKSVADDLWREQKPDHTILEEPQVLGVEALAADAVVLRLAVKTEPAEQFAISRELRRRIKLALDEAAIEIPFQQRTVWLRSADDVAPSA